MNFFIKQKRKKTKEKQTSIDKNIEEEKHEKGPFLFTSTHLYLFRILW